MGHTRSFYGGGDLEVGRMRQTGKRNKYYYTSYSGAYILFMCKKEVYSTLLLLSPLSYPCAPFCFPKRKGEDRDGMVRAWNRKETHRVSFPKKNNVKVSSPRPVPTGSTRQLEQG